MFNEVARFDNFGDVRALFVEIQDGQEVKVREVMSGPSAEVAYGSAARTIDLGLSVEDLKSADLGAPLAEWLADEDNSTIDLMDLLDQKGIKYDYVSYDGDGNAQRRPAV